MDRLLFRDRLEGRLLIGLVQFIGYPQAGRAAANAKEAALGTLQDLHGHIVPLQIQLGKRFFQRLVLGLACYFNVSHRQNSLFVMVFIVGSAPGIGTLTHAAVFVGAAAAVIFLLGLISALLALFLLLI